MVSSISEQLGVIMAALVTPTSADERVNHDHLESLVDNFIGRGVEGIYCNGSTGEGLLLSVEERAEVTRSAIRAAGGRVPVVAHVGALRTQDSIDLAKAAQAAGAIAVSMIPPTYYSHSTEVIEAHYRAVMDAVDLPMIVYNIPQFTGVEFTVKSAGGLLSDSRVVGVKQTAHNMYSVERMRTAFPHVAIINGFDEVFLSALAAGAQGTIGTTVGLQPELFKAVRNRFAAGDIAGARAVQSRINHVVDELVDVGVFPAAKYLAGRGVGDLGDCRKPFLPLSAEDRARLDALGDQIDEFVEITRGEPSSDRAPAKQTT